MCVRKEGRGEGGLRGTLRRSSGAAGIAPLAPFSPSPIPNDVLLSAMDTRDSNNATCRHHGSIPITWMHELRSMNRFRVMIMLVTHAV